MQFCLAFWRAPPDHCCHGVVHGGQDLSAHGLPRGDRVTGNQVLQQLTKGYIHSNYLADKVSDCFLGSPCSSSGWRAQTYMQTYTLWITFAILAILVMKDRQKCTFMKLKCNPACCLYLFRTPESYSRQLTSKNAINHHTLPIKHLVLFTLSILSADVSKVNLCANPLIFFQ